MTAGIRGKLVLDDRGCLRVKDPADRVSVVPVWPAPFELDTEGEDVRVLDASGRVVAQVGREVYMSGGEVGRSLEGKRQLQERCPGVYWIIGTEVRIPQAAWVSETLPGRGQERGIRPVR